jgi:hypothetical protein
MKEGGIKLSMVGKPKKKKKKGKKSKRYEPNWPHEAGKRHHKVGHSHAMAKYRKISS